MRVRLLHSGKTRKCFSKAPWKDHSPPETSATRSNVHLLGPKGSTVHSRTFIQGRCNITPSEGSELPCGAEVS